MPSAPDRGRSIIKQAIREFRVLRMMSAVDGASSTAEFVIGIAGAKSGDGSVTVAGLKLPLKSGASNDPIGLANNLGATLGATTDGFDFHAFEV